MYFTGFLFIVFLAFSYPSVFCFLWSWWTHPSGHLCCPRSVRGTTTPPGGAVRDGDVQHVAGGTMESGRGKVVWCVGNAELVRENVWGNAGEI